MPQAQCLALSQFLIYCHSRISHDASCFHVSLFLLLFCNSKINDSSSEREKNELTNPHLARAADKLSA